MSSSTSKQPVLLQSVLSMIIVATSVGSAWYCQGNLYGGRTAAHVWWYGWVTALSTGVGALPMIFCKDRMSEWWLGLANAMAGGMMTAASAALIEEGLEVSVGPHGMTATLGGSMFRHPSRRGGDFGSWDGGRPREGAPPAAPWPRGYSDHMRVREGIMWEHGGAD